MILKNIIACSLKKCKILSAILIKFRFNPSVNVPSVDDNCSSVIETAHNLGNDNSDAEAESLTIASIKAKHPDALLVLSPNSMGEVFLICAIFGQSRTISHKEIVFLCRGQHVCIPNTFYPVLFDFVYSVDIWEMRSYSERYPLISNCIHSNVLCVDASVSPPSIWELGTRRYETAGKYGLTQCEVYKFILGASLASPFGLPDATIRFHSEKLLTELDLQPRSYSILFLGNNSNIPAPGVLFDRVADKFTSDGLLVIANSKGACLSESMETSKAGMIKDLDIIDALALGINAHSVVCGANGLMIGFMLLACANICATQLHCLLTDQHCIEYEPEYKYEKFKYDISHYISIPEIVGKIRNYHEWKVPTGMSEAEVETLASDIVSQNSTSPFLNKASDYLKEYTQ